MKRLLDNLAALLKVKTIVTIAIIIVFMTLALTDKIDPNVVMNVVTTVIAFYFGTQHESKSKSDDDKR